jgi:hypothetical protein
MPTTWRDCRSWRICEKLYDIQRGILDLFFTENGIVEFIFNVGEASEKLLLYASSIVLSSVCEYFWTSASLKQSQLILKCSDVAFQKRSVIQYTKFNEKSVNIYAER